VGQARPMRLRYTRPALADLESILDYVSLHSRQGAARVHARIQTAIDLLLTHPRMGCEPTTRLSAKSMRRPTPT